MINAEEARKLMESSLSEIKNTTWEKIEESIKKAIEIGRTECDVLIRKEMVEDICWSLKYRYGYTTFYDTISSYCSSDPNCYYVTISWQGEYYA